jgi:formyltetrahydrofolate hydrolase
MRADPTNEFVLTLVCRDTLGIVHAVSGLLYQAGCNIVDSQQFGDLDEGLIVEQDAQRVVLR